MLVSLQVRVDKITKGAREKGKSKEASRVHKKQGRNIHSCI